MDRLIFDFLMIDDDDEIDHHHYVVRRPRIFRLRINWFFMLDDDDFIARFRLNKNMFLEILLQIEGMIGHNTTNNAAIPPIIQLLVAIRFFATGSFYITMGDFTGISKSSVCRIIHRTSRAIASLRRYYIRFPTTPATIRQIQKENFHRAGFIRVIGAIDCMHVRVRSYGGDDAELYRNRKSFFSINVQAIVNSRLQIMDLVARWPGSTHDSTIFDHSLIKYRFETGEFGNSYLVGDCGYPALPYLMTPLMNPRTAAEQLYNESQIRTRNMVERCFGIWGKMFAVLTIGSRFFNVESTLPVIVATAILYNLRMSVNPSPCVRHSRYDNIPQTYSPINNINERQWIIDNYFDRL